MLKKLGFAAFVVGAMSVNSVQAGSPKLARLSPPGGQRGTTVEVILQGRYLEKADEVLLYESGITVEAVESLEGEVEIAGRKQKVDTGTQVRVRLKIEEHADLGSHGLRLRTANGLTEYQRFFVSPFPQVLEDEQIRTARNDKRETAKPVELNTTVLGKMDEQVDVDLYKIEAKQGQRISAEIEASRLGVDRGIPDLHIAILDQSGKKLIAADDSALFVQDPIASIVAPKDGTYFVEVRHSIYNAANETYRLHVGTFARPTGLYPAGGPAGEELSVAVLGDPKGAWSTTVKLPAEGSDLRFSAVDTDGVSAPTPNKLRVSPFPNVLESEPNDSAEAVTASPSVLPIAFNGIIEKPGDVDCFRFVAKKGERYKFLALAQAIGSPLDATIWIKQVGPKPGATVRGEISRLNQWGFPPTGGPIRELLDPMIEFTVPVDGEFVLGVEDDRGNGGGDFIYRVEVTPETDAVLTYIPQEAENQFTPQARQAINVPSGGRYNTSISIFNANRPFAGELELVAVGLPDGVAMKAPKITSAMPRVPVVFEAAAGTKLQGKLIDIIVRPVQSAAESTEPATQVASGFRQVIPMNSYNNNDFYLHTHVDRLAIAVTEAAPFSIEVEEPKSALVQNGEMALKFKVVRTDGYDGPVTVAMEWKPNGISAATPTSIKQGQTDGEYLLGTARNATAGSYQVVLTTVSGGDRPGYYDGANRTYVSSKSFNLTVAEPHLDAKFPRASIERGKTANLTARLTHLKPFDGKAKATLTRLPRGVELIEPFREISADDKEVTFTLKATEDCLTGSYQGLTLDVTVTEDGQAVRQLTGYGTLRIDTERGVKAAAK